LAGALTRGEPTEGRASSGRLSGTWSSRHTTRSTGLQAGSRPTSLGAAARGALLIVGGAFSFLPAFGIWMFAPGMLLLAVHLPSYVA
jgi:hypothetical protein